MEEAAGSDPVQRWFESNQDYFACSGTPSAERPGLSPGVCRFESCPEYFEINFGSFVYRLRMSVFQAEEMGSIPIRAAVGTMQRLQFRVLTEVSKMGRVPHAGL